MEEKSKNKPWWENSVYAIPIVENYQYAWDEAAYMGDWTENKEILVIKKGDIVQITDEGHTWFGCLMIVSEIKDYGVIAYMDVPNYDKKPNGDRGSFNILYRGVYEKVGEAILYR